MPESTRTHCRKGHAFTEANTYIKPNGSRTCRRCRNDKAKANRKAIRAYDTSPEQRRNRKAARLRRWNALTPEQQQQQRERAAAATRRCREKKEALRMAAATKKRSSNGTGG